MLRRRQGWEQRSDPAITTRAEFLAPLMLTWPLRGAWPRISRAEGCASGEDTGWGKLIGEVMGVPSDIELTVLGGQGLTGDEARNAADGRDDLDSMSSDKGCG